MSLKRKSQKTFPELNFPRRRYRVVPIRRAGVLFLPLLFLALIVVGHVILYFWIKENSTQKELVSTVSSFVPATIASLGAIVTISTWVFGYREKISDEFSFAKNPFFKGFSFRKIPQVFTELEIIVEAPEEPWLEVFIYLKIEINKLKPIYAFSGYVPVLRGSRNLKIALEDLYLHALNLQYQSWVETKKITVGFLMANTSGRVYHIPAGKSIPKRIRCNTPLDFFKITNLELGRFASPIYIADTEEAK